MNNKPLAVDSQLIKLYVAIPTKISIGAYLCCKSLCVREASIRKEIDMRVGVGREHK